MCIKYFPFWSSLGSLSVFLSASSFFSKRIHRYSILLFCSCSTLYLKWFLGRLPLDSSQNSQGQGRNFRKDGDDKECCKISGKKKSEDDRPHCVCSLHLPTLIFFYYIPIFLLNFSIFNLTNLYTYNLRAVRTLHKLDKNAHKKLSIKMYFRIFSVL